MFNKFIKENNIKPVQIYSNLHLDYTKKLMLNNTKFLSGVYLIFNDVTGHYYIGSASTDRFYARFSNHLLYFKGSKLLKHAVKKYQLCNFTFIILKLFNETVTKENNKLLLNMEDFYLKSLLPDYNILTEAGSSFGYKHTEISRIKMKNNYSMAHQIWIGNLNRNKGFPEETKEKIKNSALIRVKQTFSEKSLLSMKKRSKPIIVYNLDKTVYGNFTSISEAAERLNCSVKTITRSLSTEKKNVKKKIYSKL